MGIEPARIEEAFGRIVENPDMEFPVEAVGPPDDEIALRVRTELDRLLDEAKERLPDREPEKGWDALQKKVRQLLHLREVQGWGGPGEPLTGPRRAALFHALSELRRRGNRGHGVVLYKWRDKPSGRRMRAAFNAFSLGDTEANRLEDAWLAHRYRVCIELASRAAREFAEHRRRAGRLSYVDLLELTAKLLRRSPGARRDLGRRYRRLLIDEFQDTDPLQAEIAFLLASEPEGEEAADAQRWRSSEPRPGALFVVGDPKQSIYRFRRADIELYNEVKERFGSIGRALTLTTNFRSCPPIGDLVNKAFASESRFPEAATPSQPAFASLDTRPCTGKCSGTHGVFTYPVGADASRNDDCVGDDAERVASWIASRTAAGEEPGSFMVLTYRKRFLTRYAEALEGRRVPYRVTGSGLAREIELDELRILLDCMVDPTNSVHAVAALTGLFFGLDYLALTRHRLALVGDGGSGGALTENLERALAEGGIDGARAEEGWSDGSSTETPEPFDITHPWPGGAEVGGSAGRGPGVAGDPGENAAGSLMAAGRSIERGPGGAGDPEVSKALCKLHEWWQHSTSEPGDIFLAELVSELGLLPHAAASPLGSQRAGALAHVLDAARTRAFAGDASLLGVRDAIAAAVESSESESQLEPGREDAVRLMNLHQAKGLEADVVVLAAPTAAKDHPVSFHCTRSDGRALGYMCVREDGRNLSPWQMPKPLAQPLGWREHEMAEAGFERAEKLRLLYVAATRARCELAVSEWRSPKGGEGFGVGLPAGRGRRSGEQAHPPQGAPRRRAGRWSSNPSRPGCRSARRARPWSWRRAPPTGSTGPPRCGRTAKRRLSMRSKCRSSTWTKSCRGTGATGGGIGERLCTSCLPTGRTGGDRRMTTTMPARVSSRREPRRC